MKEALEALRGSSDVASPAVDHLHSLLHLAGVILPKAHSHDPLGLLAANAGLLEKAVAHHEPGSWKQ